MLTNNFTDSRAEQSGSNPLQRTAKWFSDRCGSLTASRAADALAVSAKTGKPLKSRQDLIDVLIAERLLGSPKASGRRGPCSGG